MKELSIEQKARRYDEAIKKAKNTIEVNQTIPDIVECVESLFPELSESEDERIRKKLLEYFKSFTSETFFNGVPTSDAIAWLEKQGEQKPTPKHKVGDTIYYNSFGELKSMIVANVITGGTDNPMYEDRNGNAVFEKDLVEQKTAWSEEDDYNLQCCIAKVQNDIDNGRIGRNRELLTWLKSLRHQSQWKPSDEQMGGLLWVLENCAEKEGSSKMLSLANSIYDDLKKLRRE